MRMLMARWASLVLVLMSHLHVNGHDYMEISLIRLMSIRYSLRFCTKALGTGWDYGTATCLGIGSGWSPFGPLCFSMTWKRSPLAGRLSGQPRFGMDHGK